MSNGNSGSKMNEGDIDPPPKKPRLEPKGSRRQKTDERIKRMEDMLGELIKYVATIPVNRIPDVDNTDNIKSDTELVKESLQPTEKKDVATPSTSKSSSRTTKEKHSLGKPKTNDYNASTPTLTSSLQCTNNETATTKMEETKESGFPKFDGDWLNLSVHKWLHHLETLRIKYSWDDTTLICFMKKNVKGAALQWVSRQKDMPWLQWKHRFESKYGTQEIMSNLEEFISTHRRSDQRPLDFYYAKKRQGEYLRLHDDIIFTVIMHRLNDPSIEEGALNADCRDMRKLLDYLKLHNTCSNCGLRGHTSSLCYRFCSICHRAGHKSDVCNKRKRSLSPRLF